ncbi:MAG: CHAD domain-containing protein [Alphaproteobacteria bacterium]
MSDEIELKLEIEPGALAALLKADPLRARGIRFRPARRLLSAYYDSPESALLAHGIFLRVRSDGRSFVQTVKTAGEGGLLARRGEWEWRLKGPEPDLALAQETGLKPLAKRLRRNDLRQVFVSDMTRRVALVRDGDSLLELALDQGEVRAGRRRTPVCELEIEIKAGGPEPLFALARALAALPGVGVGHLTKAARGFALAAGKPQRALRAAPVVLDPALTPQHAAAAIVDACAVQAAANLPAVARQRLPEGVHQLRVALRRLRAALAVFKDVIPAEARRALRAEAGWLAGVLGPARDLDVMTADTLKATAPPPAMADDMRALARTLAAARRAAWSEAVAAAASPRAAVLMIDLAEAAATLRHAPPDDAASLTDYAAGQLERRFETVLAAAGEIDALDVEARHELRLALKKLRYAADFFAALFPRKATKKGLKVLAALQDALGGFNDAASVDAILARAVAAAPAARRAPLERAALFVSGWAAHRGALAWQEARRCWDAFAENGAFWR